MTGVCVFFRFSELPVTTHTFPKLAHQSSLFRLQRDLWKNISCNTRTAAATWSSNLMHMLCDPELSADTDYNELS